MKKRNNLRFKKLSYNAIKLAFVLVLMGYAWMYGKFGKETLYKDTYVYFPCPVEKWQRGGAPVFKDMYKHFEASQFKRPIILIYNKEHGKYIKDAGFFN